jgi:hypothetical protein
MVSQPASLGRLQGTLPWQRKARPPIALALHQFQAMDVAFGGTI